MALTRFVANYGVKFGDVKLSEALGLNARGCINFAGIGILELRSFLVNTI